MKFKECYKELNDKKIIGLVFPGYVIKKPIFMIWLGIILVLGFSILFIEGYDSQTDSFSLFNNAVYLTCPNGSVRCVNPFWLQSPCFPKDKYVCDIEFIEAGQSIGSPPKTVLSSYFGFIIFGLFVVALLLNHFLFNKNYKFEELNV